MLKNNIKQRADGKWEFLTDTEGAPVIVANTQAEAERLAKAYLEKRTASNPQTAKRIVPRSEQNKPRTGVLTKK